MRRKVLDEDFSFSGRKALIPFWTALCTISSRSPCCLFSCHHPSRSVPPLPSSSSQVRSLALPSERKRESKTIYRFLPLASNSGLYHHRERNRPTQPQVICSFFCGGCCAADDEGKCCLGCLCLPRRNRTEHKQQERIPDRALNQLLACFFFFFAPQLSSRDRLPSGKVPERTEEHGEALTFD